jgi:hypothetical protein
MPALSRVVFTAVALAGVQTPARVAAQASPYLALDDPRLPLIEHLIARGDISDPSPMMRPFRRADVVRALAAADSAPDSWNGRLIHRLRLEFEPPPGKNSWELEGRLGGQAYSHPRRELLHPAGTDGVRPLVSGYGHALIGRLALVTRGVGEPRLLDDPDWPGRRDADFIGRPVEAYVSAQFNWGTLFYGLMDRNWGPVGLPGLGFSNYSYARDAIAFDAGTRTLRLHALAADLRDERTAAGEVAHRYFFAHRLGARLSDRLQVGIWETSVLAGPERNFDGRFRNPVTLVLLANQYGRGDSGTNVLVGFDLHWRAMRQASFQLQLAIDDIQYQNRSGPTRYPDRWAVTLAGFGPLGARFGWRALYTRASSLVYRTINPLENLTDAGVGLGRNFPDMDQLTLLASAPIQDRWLLTPELTVLRQGEGRLDAPFPATPAEAGQIPQIFIGVVERTYRVAVGLDGRQGPLDLQATAGFHHVVNAGHEEGRTVNRFEGRLQATVGLRGRGELR